MSDRLIAWLRTVLPAAWSALVAWLITLGAPGYVTDTLGHAGELVVLPIVLGVLYPLLRAAESRLPDWLTRILLGSTSTPQYTTRQTPAGR